MIKIFVFLITFFISFSLVLSLSSQLSLASETGDAVCETVGRINANSGCQSDASSNANVSRVIHGGLNLLSFVAGALAVFMLILGGVKYITSRGDSAGVSSAKGYIIYALIGVVIVALSQTIAYFVIDAV